MTTKRLSLKKVQALLRLPISVAVKRVITLIRAVMKGVCKAIARKLREPSILRLGTVCVQAKNTPVFDQAILSPAQAVFSLVLARMKSAWNKKIQKNFCQQSVSTDFFVEKKYCFFCASVL